MVDVGDKQSSHRIAVAEGKIFMQAQTLQRIAAGDHKKGDVLGIARIAGIMATKRTAELVPLCHPIPLTHVDIEFSLDHEQSSICCQARTETRDRTGVEIEALCAVQLSLLTIYDMCKAVDRGMRIDAVQLLHKSGGQSGRYDIAQGNSPAK